MIYIPAPTSAETTWDTLDRAAYDHGYSVGIKGLPALKWREHHGSHCTAAALAYKKGLATFKAVQA